MNFTVNGLNQYLSGPPSAPAYDARGNLTADGYGATGSYDYDNRLISWTPAGGPATALTYDPAGRLYQLQPTGGAGTRFLYDGPNLVGEYNTSNTLLRRYVQGPGMDAPLVRYDGTGTTNKRWLLADERGSIIAETNTSGAVVQINTYDDYGVPASGNVGRFGYTGQLWLGEIGMYSYKNRIYHPGLGRFLQPDPIGLAGGLNLYAYVGGDPINFTDPWGLDREGNSGTKCETLYHYVGGFWYDPKTRQIVGRMPGTSERTITVCYGTGNQTARSVLIGGGGGAGAGAAKSGQSNCISSSNLRAGSRPSFSVYRSADAAVQAVSRGAYEFSHANGGIEVGSYVVAMSGGYALTPMVTGTATHGEALANLELGPHFPRARAMGRIVGWWHTHPGGSHNFSNADGRFNTQLHNAVGGQVAGYAVSSSQIGVLNSNNHGLYQNINRGTSIPADRSLSHGC